VPCFPCVKEDVCRISGSYGTSLIITVFRIVELCSLVECRKH
jgi:hypothetical protein